MKTEKDYIFKNRISWNSRTQYHIKSDFYNMEAFIKGNSSLNEIELKLLGDIKDKSILHLQCHFGQDTLSLERLGSKPTGIDFSDKAIDKAKELAVLLGLNSDFICCNIYDLPLYLEKKYDMVYASYGTIGWLPDLNKWAEIISHFLKPGGRFVFAEFHPFVWMFDDYFRTIQYSYFNSGAIIENEAGTYAEREAPIREECITWNHSFSDIFQSLTKNDLVIHAFNEYDYSPYNCFKEMEKTGEGKYRIKHLGDKIPMVFSLEAGKKK